MVCASHGAVTASRLSEGAQKLKKHVTLGSGYFVTYPTLKEENGKTEVNLASVFVWLEGCRDEK